MTGISTASDGKISAFTGQPSVWQEFEHVGHVCLSLIVCVCGCRYFSLCVSLLGGKYRDHIVPLRVNIPSQICLISLEKKGEKKGEERFR